ncbi:DUF975 family protein [Exiguobacterium aurantiacum]|uniref:Protein of uncharacterized function (DUF975) n=1 Tax=Exiguobacterium aurantiacum TaxID=33987 RepID=A0A377FUL3_9BACL|nr:DUF975 family protein [Exiguobacterium aurantiacum]STO08023.1 Protein of uncharacterised function (DUF975) [Exiguobacterium aurantiacum]
MQASVYKQFALRMLSGNWGIAIFAAIATMLVQTVVTSQLDLTADAAPEVLFRSILLLYGSLVLLAPLELGRNWIYLDIAKEDKPTLGLLLESFGSLKQYVRAVTFYGVFYLGLNALMLLLIVPGVWFYLTFRMVPFILRDRPDLSVWSAMRESRRLMQGKKFVMLKLFASFIGWYVLVLVTGGLALIFVQPYLETALAGFYLEVKAEKEAQREETVG